MGDVIQLGPLVIALDRLAGVAALWLFLACGSWIGRRTGAAAGRATWLALAAGLLAARLAYVIEHRDAFAAEPASAFYIWQGGFSPAYGVAAAALVLVVLLRGRPLVLAMAALLALGVGWTAIDRLGRPEPRPLPAPLMVETLEGAPVDLASLPGPYVVNLWASWCAPCRREMPMLAEVAAGRPDVPVLLVNQGETGSTVAAFLRAEGMAANNILLDRAGSVGLTTGSAALPTTLFVDRAGRIAAIHAGEISRAALLAGIRDLVDGEDPPAARVAPARDAALSM